jgi:hypothetical protein
VIDFAASHSVWQSFFGHVSNLVCFTVSTTTFGRDLEVGTHRNVATSLSKPAHDHGVLSLERSERITGTSVVRGIVTVKSLLSKQDMRSENTILKKKMTFLFLWGNIVKQKTNRKERKVFCKVRLSYPSLTQLQIPAFSCRKAVKAWNNCFYSNMCRLLSFLDCNI